MALTQYSQMSTHVPGFRSFFRFFALFCIGQISHQQKLLSSKVQERKDFRKPSKPCHVGIHSMALTEYSQMSNHLPGFRSFFRFFCIILYWPNLSQQRKLLSSKAQDRKFFLKTIQTLSCWYSLDSSPSVLSVLILCWPN